MVEVRKPPILTPETQELKFYLREREFQVRSHREQITAATGLGRGVILDSYDAPVGEKSTGRGLCLYELLRIQEDMVKNFPDIKTVLTAGEVNPRDTFRVSSHRIGHFWVRMILQDGTHLFVDDSYGQIHPLLNRTVIDFTKNEMEYYGSGIKTYPHYETRTSEQILEHLMKRRAA